MPIRTVQIVAGLLSAVAFVNAFISAGVAIISFLFALLGAGALAWLAYSLAKGLFMRRTTRRHG